MFSEKIQYNAPIPGEEFRLRDLSVPAEAARVVYEIDSQHGEDKELCLTILSRTFKGGEAITKIMHECAQSFRGQETDATAWRFHATVNRSVRISVLERKIGEVLGTLKALKSDQKSALKDRERVVRLPRDDTGNPLRLCVI